MPTKLKWILAALLCMSKINLSLQQATNSLVEKKRILDNLFENYDAGIRPTGINGTDGPVTVKVNMLLLSITSISDYDMDFGVQIFLRQEWVDERLKYEDKGKLKYLPLSDTSKIWTPDLFFLNEKDSHFHKLMAPNNFIRIYPSGLVLYSARLSLTLWCHMQLEKFPFDTQVCYMKIESYGRTTSDLKFLWRELNPIQISSNLNIMGFTMVKSETSVCISKVDSGEYSCLRVDFHFKRDLKYYILHTFIPSMVLVIVSWTSFWMDRHAVVARILLVLSTLFAMSSLATDIEASVPHVPYMKAMDLWAGACFTFLLASLVEFAIVNATSPSASEASSGEVRSGDGSTTVDMKPLVRKSTDSTQTDDKSPPQNSDAPFYQGLLKRLPREPSRIDSIARVLFPSIFIIFVFFYFFIYSIFDSPSRLD